MIEQGIKSVVIKSQDKMQVSPIFFFNLKDNG